MKERLYQLQRMTQAFHESQEEGPGTNGIDAQAVAADGDYGTPETEPETEMETEAEENVR